MGGVMFPLSTARAHCSPLSFGRLLSVYRVQQGLVGSGIYPLPHSGLWNCRRQDCSILIHLCLNNCTHMQLGARHQKSTMKVKTEMGKIFYLHFIYFILISLNAFGISYVSWLFVLQINKYSLNTSCWHSSTHPARIKQKLRVTPNPAVSPWDKLASH